MKIAFLLTQSLESPSGLGRYWPLARELSNLGHQVEIYALHPDFENLIDKSYQEQGVQIRYVAPMHVKKYASQKSYYQTGELLSISLRATIGLCKQAFSSGAEIIHICKPHPMNSIAGLTAKWLKGKRIFLDCDDYEAGSGNFSSQWQRSIIAYFEKVIPHHSRIITTNTKYMIENLKSWRIPEDKIVYLPNGVDRERFQQSPHQDELLSMKSRLGLNNKAVISYIGSLSLVNHAVDLLLQAFAILKTELPESVLLLVGGGEDYQALIDLSNKLGIKQDVRYVGRVKPQGIPLYYYISDLTVDPVYDNVAARGRSPLKMFESWACDTPFITSDVGDRGELIGSPPAGFITKAGDPFSLANGMQKILSDPDLANDCRIYGQRRVKDYYWDRLVQQINYIYEGNLPN